MTVELSPRAKALWRRVREGRWYPVHHPKTPKAMKELIDAGLVGRIGRIGTIVACHVPAHTLPLQMERLPQLDGPEHYEHADGGVYRIVHRGKMKDAQTGAWLDSVAYTAVDFDEKDENGRDIPVDPTIYMTTLTRWCFRFTLIPQPLYD